MNYFEIEDYVSNSELGMFDIMIHARPESIPEGRKQAAYNFGNLFEQTHGVDSFNQKFADSFDESDLEKARLMSQALNSDPTLGTVFNHMKKQHEVYREVFPITYHGETITLPVKCKLDGINKPLNLAVDLKSTACVSYDQFINAFHYFRYARQAAWYMDLANVDRMLYIGVSKKAVRGKHPVFSIAIKRGDEIYQKGFSQYSYLAYKYHYMIYLLDLSNYVLKIN